MAHASCNTFGDCPLGVPLNPAKARGAAWIDAYHQAWEDHRDALAEGSDNIGKACAESLATEAAMRDRFSDYQSHYKLRYPGARRLV